MIYSHTDTQFIPEGPLSMGMESVYYSNDIEKTLSWFSTTLGWLTRIELKDDDQTIVYASAYTVPYQQFISPADMQRKIKVHILQGTPRKDMVSIIPTTKLEKLVALANKNSKEKISIQKAYNGNLYANLTTIDGSILTFYQEASHKDL